MSLRIGCDVGGTFTDLVGIAEDGTCHGLKVRSDRAAPAEAILAGVGELLDRFGMDGPQVAFFGHGTTVVTNMVIEREGAPLAVATTEGFRDVLELGRQARPHVYDYRVRRPAPLARRAHRIEVAERIASDGSVLCPLTEDAIGATCEALRATGAGAIAVLFLHAHRNPSHERALAEALRQRLPGVYVSASHEVAAEHREFERFSTTALNAFVGPRASRYFDHLREGLSARGITAPLYTVTSSGGLIDEASARQTPIRTALSGPAAGVTGIARILAAHGPLDLITCDVGGTSTDIAVLAGAEPRLVASRDLAGNPVLSPMVDIEVIGAGGGSIAQVLPGGTLTVGPQSAGADPGPAAYGSGGTRATVTDAALVLGRIGPQTALGGRLRLDVSRARTAIRETIAEPLGLAEEEAAEGILAVAVANMARTIRSAVVARGAEPERFTLAAYGGAGPMLAADVAEALGMRRIAVPASPGTLCARALLLADIARHEARTAVRRLTPQSLCEVRADALALERDGTAWLTGEGVPPHAQRLTRTVSARYEGQSFEITIDFTQDDTATTLAERFHAAHRREQGFALPDRPVEIVTVRLAASAAPEGRTGARPSASPSPPGTAPSTRRVVFSGGALTCAIHRRDDLHPGSVVAGPAIIEETTATTLVPPGWRAETAADGTLFLTTRAAEGPP